MRKMRSNAPVHRGFSGLPGTHRKPLLVRTDPSRLAGIPLCRLGRPGGWDRSRRGNTGAGGWRRSRSRLWSRCRGILDGAAEPAAGSLAGNVAYSMIIDLRILEKSPETVAQTVMSNLEIK